MNREQMIKENTEQRKVQVENLLRVNGLEGIKPSDAVKMAFPKAFEDLSPSAKRGYLNTEQFFNAYNLDTNGESTYRHVAWRSLFVPTEIMYAMGLLPFTTEMVASQLAMTGAARERIETAEAHNFSGDLCSFMKAVAGGVIENIFPTPDILITSTHLCDPSAKYSELAAHTYKRPEFILDIPYGLYDLATSGSEKDLARVEEGVDYIYEQLQEMIAFITEHTGLTLESEKMRQVIQWTNEARTWLNEGNDTILAERTSARKGVRELDYAANVMQTWGTQRIVDVYKSRCKEYKANLDPKSDNTEPRITWFHLRPYFKTPLMTYLDEKIDISSSQVNFAFWEPLDPADPIRSIARRTALHPAFSSVTARTRMAINEVSDDIDGIIAYYPKSCRHFHGGSIMENEMFKKAGVPILTIDGDCIDDRGDDFPIVKTRVDRFLKSLKKNPRNTKR